MCCFPSGQERGGINIWSRPYSHFQPGFWWHRPWNGETDGERSWSRIVSWNTGGPTLSFTNQNKLLVKFSHSDLGGHAEQRRPETPEIVSAPLSTHSITSSSDLIRILNFKIEHCFSANSRLIPEYELLEASFVGHSLACWCKPQPTRTAGLFSDCVYIDGNSSLNSWTVACKCSVHVLRKNKVFKLIMIAINDIWKKRNWAKTSTLEMRSPSRSDRRWLSQLLYWSSDEGTLQQSFIFKDRRKVADGVRLHAYEQEMTCTRSGTSWVHSCEVFHC